MTQPKPFARLRELLLSGATTKPWEASEGAYFDRWGTSNALSSNCCIYTKADAELICELRNNAERLLQCLDEAEKVLKEAREKIDGEFCDSSFHTDVCENAHEALAKIRELGGEK